MFTSNDSNLNLLVRYDYWGWGLAEWPLGYNTWYDFECNNINAENIRKVAFML